LGSPQFGTPKYWDAQDLGLPKINITINNLNIKMQIKTKVNSSTLKVSVFGETKELGRILSHEGNCDILKCLIERPKRYKEIFTETNISNTTLERGVRGLLAAQIVKKMPITSENRETHQYQFTSIGKELMRFITNYEKIIKLPDAQQKIVEVDKV
jgi:DNA-binding HxlR family transcriptional regulator